MQTLFESWELRRQLLESKANPLDESIASAQKQILDNLLKRYRGVPIANVTAAFPARMEMKIDRRTVVAHEPVGRNLFSGVKNEAEASSRASRILKRISNLDPQGSVSAPGDGIFNDPLFMAQGEASMEPAPRTIHDVEAAAKNGAAALPETTAPQAQLTVQPQPPAQTVAQSAQQDVASLTYRQRLAWGRIHAAIKGGDPSSVVLSRIRTSLSLGKALPERAVTYLFDQCGNPLMCETMPAELLAQCINASVPMYALLAWRDRLAALAGPDDVAERLRKISVSELMRKSSLSHVRPYLADSHASVRLEAAMLVSDIGSLHDIGLLLDLAALPRQADEDPSERTVLLNAAEKLASAQ